MSHMIFFHFFIERPNVFMVNIKEKAQDERIEEREKFTFIWISLS